MSTAENILPPISGERYLGVFILKSYVFIVAIDPVVCEVVIDGVGIDMASGTLVGPSREEVRSEFRISDEIGRN